MASDEQKETLKEDEAFDLGEVDNNDDLESPIISGISGEHDDDSPSSPEPEEAMIHKEASPEAKVCNF